MEREVKLAIVPGTEKFFGPGAEGHIRICFATSHAILKEGLDRLERGMAMLKK
jgi:cystathionine beta-lyase